MFTRKITTACCILAGLTLAFAGGCEKKQAETNSGSAQTTQPAGGKEAAASPVKKASYDVADEPLAAKDKEAIMALDVEGMTCNKCANTVGTCLTGIKGVEKARVSLDRKTAWIEFDPQSPPDVAAILAAIKEAGYKAKVLTDINSMFGPESDDKDDDSSSDG